MRSREAKAEPMLPRTWFLWVASALCCCACAHASGQLTGVRLECEIETKTHRLEVSYSIQNGSTGEIAIFNSAPGVTSSCYVDFQDPNLLIKKVVLPVPAGLEMTARLVPEVRLLRKAEIFREQFSLSIPVAVNNPYRLALLVGRSPGANFVANKLRHAYNVTFSVGVFQSHPSLRFDPVGRAESGIYYVWPPGLAIDTQVILSKTVRLQEAVDVLDF